MGAKETKEAIRELEDGKGKKVRTLEELLDDLNDLTEDVEVDLDQPLPTED